MPILNSTQHALIGRTLGNRYFIERALGTGAMGTVYRARRIDVGTWVAVKVMHPHLAHDPGLVLRFEREAFATARLDHPNALRVLDFGEDGDVFYLVTEYLEATDLLSIMHAEWPLGDERVVSILSQVLSALVAVHEIGIVHRDLKPENILVFADKNDDGATVDVVKVCDFGIAKVARSMPSRKRPFTPRLTAEGVMVGTPDYMSPEQARGQGVDGRSDLYAVGVILYHLLAGRTPFDADTPVGIALQHLSDAPIPPSRYRRVHRGLEAVCLRALAKRPEDRFQTAREMRKALHDALTVTPAAALVPGWMAALHVGSNFSTSSPAMLSLRTPRRTLAHSRFRDRERRRRRMSIGYAAVASVATITASAWVARRSGTSGPATSTERVHATTLVYPPHLPTSPIPSHESASELEQRAVVAPSGPAMSLRVAQARRPVTRRQPLPAPKPRPRNVVVVAPPALAISPVPPVTTSPVLVRNEPWSTPREAPDTTQLIIATPVPPELRGGIEPRPSPSSRQEGALSPVEPSRASVSISSVAASAGISSARVSITLAHVPLSACYQQALGSRSTESPFDAELRLTIDVGGRIESAVLSRDGSLPGLRSCFDAVLRVARVRDVGTGVGSATAQLRFSPR